MQVNMKNRIDEVQCDQTVRELRWPVGLVRPSGQSTQVIKRGFKDTIVPCTRVYTDEYSIYARLQTW